MDDDVWYERNPGRRPPFEDSILGDNSSIYDDQGTYESDLAWDNEGMSWFEKILTGRW